MIIVKTRKKLAEIIHNKRAENAAIGFIPTMGALHEGHLQLLKKGIQNNLTTVCSIFINPTQFNEKSDFDKYPVTIESDIYLLETAGCNILFLPSVEEMYPPNEINNLQVNLGNLDNILEGKYRPGHFDGVCQIVHKLLQTVQPDVLFLGQKDYQQCMVIQKMIQQADFAIIPRVEIVPTIRETSGLAMSSRNKRLSDTDVQNATAIYKAMSYIQDSYSKVPYDELMNFASDMLKLAGFQPIDYCTIADAVSLEPVTNPATYHDKMVVLMAAYLNGVRLIDNILLS